MSTRDQKSGGSGLTGLKTTLLENLCGIKGGNKGVILVSATNFPWQLEPAFIRRSQMIYVGLPDSVEERVSILRLYLEADNNLSKSDWKQLGKVTKGMSASDLEKVSKKTWSLVKDEMLRSSNFKEIGSAQGKKVFCPINGKYKKGLNAV